MPRYSPNISFMMQVSKKISDKLIRDYTELENLQSSIQSSEKFALSSLFRVKEMVMDEITRFRPDDNILIEGEKEYVVSKNSSQRWVVEPICGFGNFARSLPYFCFLISLETKNKDGVFEVVASFVEMPIINEIFYAEKNAGAFSSKKRLRVSSLRDIKNALISTDTKQNKLGYKNIRWNDCLPLELCYVASGKYDACIIENSKDIERNAGLFIIKESGGKTTNLSGNDYNDEEGFIVSNGNIHKELVEKI